MLQHYHDRYGIRSVSLRIGTFRAQPIDQRSLATWLSPGDAAHLIDVSLRHPDPGCMVVNGYSNNTRLKTVDPNWATLGYKPKDNAEDHREALRAKGIDPDSGISLGPAAIQVLRESENQFSHLILVPAKFTQQTGHVSQAWLLLCTNALLIRGKVVTINVFSLFSDATDRVWVTKECNELVQTVFLANG